MNRNPPVTAYGGDSPLAKGGLLEQDWSLQAPKPPLLKGGAPAGGGGIPFTGNLPIGRNPPATARRAKVSNKLKNRPKGWHFVKKCHPSGYL